MESKLPPSDLKTEVAISGIYICFPESQKKISQSVLESDFYDSRCRAIFKYIYNHIQNKDTDVIHPEILINSIQSDTQKLKECGGQSFLDECCDVITQSGLDSLIKKLKDLSTRRDIMGKCYDIIESCYRTMEVQIEEIIGDMRIVLEYSGNRNLAQEVKDWVDNISGSFTVTNCDNELQIKTKKDKQNRRTILHRLEKQGLIEKTNRIAGEYRKIENDFQEEDWLNADESPIKIMLPFGLSQYCLVFPGDIIIFSGSKSTGKTAIALTLIKLNRRNFDKIYYHSSELNKNTFRRRLTNLEDFDPRAWKNVAFIGELSAELAHDRVKPGTLNVFDYLEIEDGAYYKLPGIITKIHRKLKGGVAVICLQKDVDKKFAVGGEQTRAKANLYCLLQPDRPGEKLIIDNCKAWAQEDVNPQGFEIHYKIYKGVNIYTDGSLQPGLATAKRKGAPF